VSVEPHDDRLRSTIAFAQRVHRIADWRKTMLSHHELATLLRVKHAPDAVPPRCAELRALRERQLVEWDRLPSGAGLPRITKQGRLALRSILRFKAWTWISACR
jgi:hypothetical protein